AAHFLFTSDLINADEVEFSTLSGILTAKRVSKAGKLDSSALQNGEAQGSFFIELDFPVVPTIDFNCAEVAAISKSLNGASVIDIKKTAKDDLFVVLPSGEAVEEIQPQFDEIEKCAGRE
ncbi:unnamed protein product, partial [Ilex paraguariensis]